MIHTASNIVQANNDCDLQWGIEKLAIGMRTDSNGNDPGTNNATTKQIYGVGIPKKDHSNRERKTKPPSGGEG